MRPHSPQRQNASESRLRIERLDALPIRPASALSLLGQLSRYEAGPESSAPASPSPRSVPLQELDPGWVLQELCGASQPPSDHLQILAEARWWSPAYADDEGLQRLWRHSVATSLAARRLAIEAKDPNPTELARVALLLSLGLWAWAAVDPRSFAEALATTNPRQRQELERDRLGCNVGHLGMLLAERWQCHPLLAEAIWTLTAWSDSASSPVDPRIAILRAAWQLAERTPWGLAGSAEPNAAVEPRVRLLTAEVQARCGGPFIDPAHTAAEEKLARENARLRLDLARLKQRSESQDRFIAAFVDAPVLDQPESWAERACLAWCDEPGVSAARVVWTNESSGTGPEPTSPRPPLLVLPLRSRARLHGEIHLWGDLDEMDSPDQHPTLKAWASWAALVASQRRLLSRVERTTSPTGPQPVFDDSELRRRKLEALAEFAAGAGHELNNPLAVIVGRAQLLLSKHSDPDAVRSLRTIISQAQRTNRILRDLMYVARPPEPRYKLCNAEEILKNAVRDLQGDAELRGVRLSAELRGEPQLKVWTDPDALRHIADSLLRNALEGSTTGSRVTVSSTITSDRLEWRFRDEGRGISDRDLIHLFDPFYCGRQAGRGLGMGLPRTRRLIERLDGDLRWSTTPGKGTLFQLHLPLHEPPMPATPPQGGESLPKSA